jgi:hypothetical protein
MGRTTNTSAQVTSKYQGKTKKEWKRTKGSTTPGSAKGENCKATGLDKALIKYPRAYKTMPDLFEAVYKKKERYTTRSA